MRSPRRIERAVGAYGLDPLGRVAEDLKRDNRSGAAAKDGRRLVRQVLDQAPDVISIGIQPVIIVLRPVERTLGKTTAVVDHHLVLRRKEVCERAEDLSLSPGPWDQDQEWPVAAYLIRQLCTGNLKGTHTLSFFLI